MSKTVKLDLNNVRVTDFGLRTTKGMLDLDRIMTNITKTTQGELSDDIRLDISLRVSIKDISTDIDCGIMENIASEAVASSLAQYRDVIKSESLSKCIDDFVQKQEESKKGE